MVLSMTRQNTEIVYGIHASRHAMEMSLPSVLEIWIQEDKKESAAISQLIKLAEGISLQFVSKQTLDKLSQYEKHQGIVIRKRIEKINVSDLETLLRDARESMPIFLVLDGVQDPHNLGACLRTADAAGVRAVILPRDRAVGLNATVRKVASGAAENVPVIEVTNLARTLRQMQEAGLWIIGTADNAENSIFQVDLNRPLALVMGAEGKGLRLNTRNHCDTLAYIPMAGIVESLNVSVASGICLYEAVRQRSHSP